MLPLAPSLELLDQIPKATGHQVGCIAGHRFSRLPEFIKVVIDGDDLNSAKPQGKKLYKFHGSTISACSALYLEIVFIYKRNCAYLYLRTVQLGSLQAVSSCPTGGKDSTSGRETKSALRIRITRLFHLLGSQ